VRLPRAVLEFATLRPAGVLCRLVPAPCCCKWLRRSSARRTSLPPCT